jgi:hypothetical protein
MSPGALTLIKRALPRDFPLREASSDDCCRDPSPCSVYSISSTRVLGRMEDQAITKESTRFPGREALGRPEPCVLDNNLLEGPGLDARIP